MTRTTLLGALLTFGILSITAVAFQDPQRPRATAPDIRQVRGNLYVIGGSAPEDRASFTGSNTVVWITNTGVVLVDTKNPTWGPTILERVRSVTTKPVTTIINTHAHSDHSGSNTEFSPTVEFVAHENTKAIWSQEKCTPVGNCASFKGDNAKFLPKTTYKDKMSLFSGKDRIDLFYYGRDHTSGDAWIVFPAVRTLAVGDLFRPKVPPFMDVGNGGSGLAFPETLAKGIAAISNVDTVIPGHGPVMGWDDLKMYRDFMQNFVSYVRSGARAGRSVTEMAVSYKVPEQFKGYMEGPQEDRKKVNEDIQVIYDELNKK